MNHEIAKKIATVRKMLKLQNLAGVRLRGSDWFAWATGGGSNVVLLTTDSGIAEILITPDEAWVLTNTIEAERLNAEELKPAYTLWQGAWHRPEDRDSMVRELTHAGLVASDRPGLKEMPLPPELITAKRCLLPEEIERYRTLGRDAAEAMTETLADAREGWTGYELAARGAAALWRRGIHPALVLVGDARRLPLYRHPTASQDLLGDRAMLVFCARRHGLFANLSRLVYFREPSAHEFRMKYDLAAIEAEIFEATRAGVSLAQVFQAMRTAYAKFGYPDEMDRHHQGGPTGYLSREEIALPHADSTLERGMAVAWNPSLAGAKMEDTVLISDDGLEILTVDPLWPTFLAEDRRRPDYWVRT